MPLVSDRHGPSLDHPVKTALIRSRNPHGSERERPASVIRGIAIRHSGSVATSSSRHCAQCETVTALDAISFDLKRVETLTFIGHHGADKSTLLHAVSGTLWPCAGFYLVLHGGGITRARCDLYCGLYGDGDKVVKAHFLSFRGGFGGLSLGYDAPSIRLFH